MFHETYLDYTDDNFSKMGKNLAEMAWLLEDPEHDKLSDLWD